MQTQIYPAIPRTRVLNALTRLRQDWQDAAAGRSLMFIDANVALLLVDVAMAVGLDTIERVQVLGAELTQELDDFLAPKPGGNGSH